MAITTPIMPPLLRPPLPAVPEPADAIEVAVLVLAVCVGRPDGRLRQRRVHKKGMAFKKNLRDCSCGASAILIATCADVAIASGANVVLASFGTTVAITISRWNSVYW
jgi:hypothetical protein